MKTVNRDQIDEIKRSLEVIRSLHGQRKSADEKAYTKQAWEKINRFMDENVCDISAAEFLIDPRYVLQVAEIPERKTGNLKPYAGKDVVVFTTTVRRSGARINYFIAAITYK